MGDAVLQLDPQMQAHVDERLASGAFDGVEDYIQALIRDDEARLHHLRAEIARGDASALSPLSGSGIVASALATARRSCA